MWLYQLEVYCDVYTVHNNMDWLTLLMVRVCIYAFCFLFLCVYVYMCTYVYICSFFSLSFLFPLFLTFLFFLGNQCCMYQYVEKNKNLLQLSAGWSNRYLPRFITLYLTDWDFQLLVKIHAYVQIYWLPVGTFLNVVFLS